VFAAARWRRRHASGICGGGSGAQLLGQHLGQILAVPGPGGFPEHLHTHPRAPPLHLHHVDESTPTAPHCL
jgi:hypothetical protein